ncbi:hypothetical protein FK85_07000 [Halorubrum saccharovorum]|uniref:DUF7573 domain-containing protein n=1 Tax=Halorubrum saccharovorum TaxID=2248 RepID=A0A081EUE1_9EURY|nr:hypothetical protein [Halorubrum saccharovorum]KDS91029.1 hypothetical protein FK85_07000 [Halorubrum saccharovorum]
MPEDRSLDDFGGDEPAESDPGEAESTEAEPVDAAGDDSASAGRNSDDGVDEVTPATATATWTTGGAGCERCGDRVERRWLDDGDRVCPDCKTW